MKDQWLAWTAWSAAMLVSILTAMGYADGWRINTTPSMPIGLWKQDSLSNPLHRHQIVSFCPINTNIFKTARARGYLTTGFCSGGYEPLLKPVAAIPGDRVKVTAEGLFINGRLIPNSRIQFQDGAGRWLPHVPIGVSQVAPDTVWLISNHTPASFDSRYFGPISVSQVQGVMHPVLVREGIP